MSSRYIAIFSFLAALGLSVSCSTTPETDRTDEQLAEQPGETAAGEPDEEPISRTDLFGDPQVSHVRISPDGAYISYLAPHDGVKNIWIAPVDNPDEAEPITDDDDRGIHWFFWSYADDHLLYGQDDDGDENWTLYDIDVATGEQKRLSPESGVHARPLRTSPDYPEEILVQLNDRDPQYHDVHRVNIIDGTSEMVLENPGFSGFVADGNLDVRLATRETSDGGSQWLIADPEADDEGDIPAGWTHYQDVPMEDSLTTRFIGFDRSNDTAYAVDSRDEDTAGLVEFEFGTQDRQVLHQDPRADVVDTLRHPSDRTIQAAAVEYERVEWTVLDDDIDDDFNRLAELEDGQMQVLDRSYDDDLWIVHYEIDDGPASYYLYDRDDQSAEFLFHDRPQIEDASLSPMTPVVIETRDGLEMVSYLTVPHFVETDASGFPEEALPMVLNVHGGPWARDSWGYNPEHQWLADRGYAVLSVNFRGSTGFGKDFINAANREWGAAMHDDLIDAVDWAVDREITDEETVAIMGGSYGGYATLAGLTFTPETFACGVNIVGVSNLLTLLESIPPYWEPMRAMFTTRVGDPETEEGHQMLQERSPVFSADQIERPLLIGHGAHDPRVRQEESDQMVEAMQQSDIPVTYALYPDEGHGFRRPENRISFYALAEAFLAPCLGGRFEPVGDDFDGASLEVLEGADEVPGLPEALQQR